MRASIRVRPSRTAASVRWLVLLGVAACRSSAPAVSPAEAGGGAENATSPAEGASAPAAAGTPAAAPRSGAPSAVSWSELPRGEWRPIRTPPAPLAVTEAAALDSSRVAVVAGGRLLRLAEGAWRDVPIAGRARSVRRGGDRLWVEAVGSDGAVRVFVSADGVSFAAPSAEDGPAPDFTRPVDSTDPCNVPVGGVPATFCTTWPEGFDAVLAAGDVDGRRVLVADDGRVLVWIADRVELVERYVQSPTHGELRGWFEEPRSAEWMAPAGVVPPRTVAVLPTRPSLLVGADGAVWSLDCGRSGCFTGPIVDTRPPRVLALVALADGAVLLAAADGLVRLEPGGERPVRLDDAGAEWLRDANVPGPWGGREVQAVAVGADAAVLTAVGQRRGLWVEGDVGTGFDLPNEPLGAAPAGDGEAAVLLNHGAVMRGRAGRWREAGRMGDVPPAGVSHAFGLFRGGDGVVRLLDPRRPLICLRDDALRPCGADVVVDERRVHPLADGLLVETQQIRVVLAGASGIRDVGLLAVWDAVAAAGTVDSPFVLAETREGEARVFRVIRWNGADWERVIDVPSDPIPEALAAGPGGSLFVAAEGGVVVASGGRIP